MSVTPHDGLVAVVKRDCPTCELTAPVLGELARRVGLQVYTQDDPSFPETVPERIDDTALDISHRLKIEIVKMAARLSAPMAGIAASGSGSPGSVGWARTYPNRVPAAAPKTSSPGSSND